ncbi:hypothetical protein VSR01_11485 [Actinacidiphila sp. DG2A-62]|uniref:hypothetical protein n=1 Tax=Actinacidiphila sp. DG2A-62 TaxID=3108821 RepID=UPI002DBDC586|nr:hypothetical protein [Actinacidiphila sp. DG2A-62]MEC3994131.1 hypothetical protein [Actinacidiphila sp. DG2A-62]
MMPSAVPAQALLLRTPGAAVWLGLVRAYPNGFECTLRVLRRGGDAEDEVRPGFRRDPDPFANGLRLGVGYPDGRRGVAGDRLRQAQALQDADEETLRVLPASAGGNMARWDAELWITPLPPAGPVTVVAVWPEVGIADEQHAVLDGTQIRAAGERAVPLWPEEGLAEDAPAVSVRALVVDGDGPADDAGAEGETSGGGAGGVTRG